MVRSTKPYPVSGAFLAHYVRGAFPVLSDEAIGRDHLGISKSRLSNLLNGVRPAGPHNLTTIARVVAASGAFQGLQAKPFATAYSYLRRLDEGADLPRAVHTALAPASMAWSRAGQESEEGRVGTGGVR